MYERYDRHSVVSTVVVNGFPEDASWRELKNLPRLLPGWELSHVVQSAKNGRTSLFAKFDSPEAAELAISHLNGMSFDLDQDEWRLRAEMAHRDTELPGRGEAQPPRQERWADPREPRRQRERTPRRDGGSRRRYVSPEEQRHGEHTRRGGVWEAKAPPRRFGGAGESQEGDTLICRVDNIVAARHSGELERRFEALPGYMGLRFNEKARAAFVRFQNRDCAQDSLNRARNLGLEVSVAKRSLEL